MVRIPIEIYYLTKECTWEGKWKKVAGDWDWPKGGYLWIINTYLLQGGKPIGANGESWHWNSAKNGKILNDNNNKMPKVVVKFVKNNNF
jgi:hypothetical protein